MSPARAGQGNEFHFYLLGRDGAPLAVAELDATITLPSRRVGPITLPLVVAGPGHYRASGVRIPVSGAWVLKLTVRTATTHHQEVFGTIPVS